MSMIGTRNGARSGPITGKRALDGEPDNADGAVGAALGLSLHAATSSGNAANNTIGRRGTLCE
jgi:hypothetical protein